MFQLSNIPQNKMQGNRIVLSAPIVIKNLRELGLNPEYSEMLYTTQKRAQNKLFKEEATKLLIALSSPPTPEFRSMMRRDKAAIEKFIVMRYDAVMQRKTTTVKMPYEKNWDVVANQMFYGIMPTLNYEII